MNFHDLPEILKYIFLEILLSIIAVLKSCKRNLSNLSSYQLYTHIRKSNRWTLRKLCLFLEEMIMTQQVTHIGRLAVRNTVVEEPRKGFVYSHEEHIFGIFP